MTNTEEKMTLIINEFKSNLSRIAEDAISDVYMDVLPHVESDTFMNVQYRSNEVVKNMLSGAFKRVDENTVSVVDGNNIAVEIKITDDKWDSIRRKLIEVMPSCPKDLEIESLKNQIRIMEDSRSYY